MPLTHRRIPRARSRSSSWIASRALPSQLCPMQPPSPPPLCSFFRCTLRNQTHDNTVPVQCAPGMCCLKLVVAACTA
eukprot:1213163-Rhodomonas_salina.1